jgi:hypothetical protein
MKVWDCCKCKKMAGFERFKALFIGIGIVRGIFDQPRFDPPLASKSKQIR